MKYLIVDIETTGFAATEGVTEITAIEYDRDFSKGRVIYDGLTDPGKDIPWRITELTHITNEMVQGKPPYRPVFKTLVEHAINNNLTIVAHNAPFEIRFFIENVGETKVKSVNWACTRAAQMSILNVNQFAKHVTRLQDCARHFGYTYDLGEAHRAKYDVELTAKVMKKQLDVLGHNDFVYASKKFIGW